MYDLLIRDGRVVDGTGNPWFRADTAVSRRDEIRLARVLSVPGTGRRGPEHPDRGALGDHY